MNIDAQEATMESVHDEFEIAMPKIDEPFLTAELEDSAGEAQEDWHERALVCLAEQLTVKNDFYYPLLGAADRLRSLRRVRDGLVDVLRAVNPMVQK